MQLLQVMQQILQLSEDDLLLGQSRLPLLQDSLQLFLLQAFQLCRAIIITIIIMLFLLRAFQLCTAIIITITLTLCAAFPLNWRAWPVTLSTIVTTN